MRTLIIIAACLLLQGCNKEKYSLPYLPEVVIQSTVKNSTGTWTFNGEVRTVDDNPITDSDIINQGFEIDFSGEKTLVNASVTNESENTNVLAFYAPNNKLELDKAYTIRAFVDLSNGRIFSNSSEQLNTIGLRLTSSYEEKNQKVTLFGTISGLSDTDEVIEHGHCWIASSQPLELNNLNVVIENEQVEKTDNGSRQNGRFDDLPPFNPVTYYYVRPYAKFDNTYFYGEINEIFIGDSWEQLSPFTTNCNGAPPGCLYVGVGFSIGKKGYVGLGSNDGSNYNRSFWEYDTETGDWRLLVGAPRQLFLGQARGAAVAFTIEGKAYVGSGSSGRGSTEAQYKDFYSYSPSEGWSSVDDSPIFLRSGTAFVIGNKAYVGAGYSCPQSNSPRALCDESKRFFEFDPLRQNGKQWREVKNLPETTLYAASFSIDNRGYVVSGIRPYSYMQNSWSFNPNVGALDTEGLHIGEWRQVAQLPGSVRQRAVGFSLNGKGYIGTGTNDELDGEVSSLYDLWSYDPITDSWAVKPNLGSNNRHAAQSFVVANESLGEQAYVYGGRYYYTSQGRADDLWVFTPDK